MIRSRRKRPPAPNAALHDHAAVDAHERPVQNAIPHDGECRMLIRTLSLSLMLAAGFAHAGTILESVNRDLDNPAESSTVRTYAQDGKMRVEQKPEGSLMIFKNDTLYTIDERQKSYAVMDRATMKRMAEQMSPAIKQMQEQLAKMPPEQRAQMEQMMGGRGMPGMAKKKQKLLRKTARTDKIGSYACTYVEQHEDGIKTEELCIVPPAAIKGTDELMAAARNMSKFVKEILESMNSPWLEQMVNDEVKDFDTLGGIPVLSREFSGGKPVSETIIKSVRSEALSASMFDVPAGYAKKDVMAQP
jgi:hypothetical protein